MITQKQNDKTMNLVILFMSAVLLLFVSVAKATVFTATSSGNWSSSATWGGSSPGVLISGDQVIIPVNVTVNLDQDISLSGALSSLDVNGMLSGSTNTVTVINGTLTGTGSIDVNSIDVSGTGSILFSGNLMVETLVNSSSQLVLTASTFISGSLQLVSGIVSVSTGGNITISSGAIIELNGGQVVLNGGLFTGLNSYDIIYGGGSTSIGLEATGSGLNDITVNLSGDNQQLTMTGDLELDGQLNIQQGQLIVGSNSLSVNGIVTSSGGTLVTNGQSSLSISGSTNGNLNFIGNLPAVGSLTINVGSSIELTLESNLWVSGDLNFTSGILDLNGYTLSVSGDMNLSSNAQFSSAAGSSLEIHSDGSVNGQLTFTGGMGQLNDLQIDIANGGNVELGSDVTVSGTLDLDAGFVIIGNNDLIIGTSGEITGGGLTTYIIAEGSGTLIMTVSAGGQGTVFPVGTSVNFSPVTLVQANGSTTGAFGVSLMGQVYSEGTTGFSLSNTTSIVENTWLIESNLSSGIDLTLSVEWAAGLEVNSFNNDNCFISHYVNGDWDASAQVSAGIAASGNFTISRSGITSLSPFAVFDNATTVGVETVQKEIDVELFPNPAKDWVAINIDQPLSNFNLDIYDKTGRFISANNFTESRKVVDISSLASGIYIFKIWNNDYINVTKVVKE
ncbi:MAG: T9SS type A sorting domain-containing protein [Bacteroidia bacterium]